MIYSIRTVYSYKWPPILNQPKFPIINNNSHHMTSTKLNPKPILPKSSLSTRDHSFIDPHTSTYKSYECQLDNNIKTIMRKYNNLDSKKVKELLEELDNRLELAMEILEEENYRHVPIMEEGRDYSKPKRGIHMSPTQ